MQMYKYTATILDTTGIVFRQETHTGYVFSEDSDQAEDIVNLKYKGDKPVLVYLEETNIIEIY